MTNKSSHPNTYFWLLIIMAVILIGTGLAIGWDQVQIWGQALWQICRNRLQNLAQNLPLIWQFLLAPAIILAMVARIETHIKRWPNAAGFQASGTARYPIGGLVEKDGEVR